MYIPVNILLIKDLTSFKGIFTVNPNIIGSLLINPIFKILPLTGSLLQKVSEKPSSSGTSISFKINGGTAIFNGVTTISIKKTLSFLKSL